MLQSLLSTLLQEDVRSLNLCDLWWFASLSTFLSNWYSAVVSANPWNVVHFVLWVTATQFLIVFFENMFFSAGELFPVVFLVLARVLAKNSCSCVDSGTSSACVLRRFPSLVILQCSVFLVDSFEDQVGLGLSPCLMDKIFVEHIQIFLDRNDLLCLRVVAHFHATCEWFGPGWTVVLSPLVHVVRRLAWDLSEDFLWRLDYLRFGYPSQCPCARCSWNLGIWCTACVAGVTGGLRNFPFSPWVKLTSGCSVTSKIFCTVRSKRRFSLCRRI